MKRVDRFVEWLEALPEMKTLEGRARLFARGAGIIVAAGFTILIAKWSIFDVDWTAADMWNVAGLTAIVGAIIVSILNPNYRDDLPDDNKYN